MLVAPTGSAAEPASGSTSAASADARPYTAGVLDPGRGYPGRWAREFDRRKALLKAGPARDPSRLLGITGILADLQGEIPNARLAEVLEGTMTSSAQDPLVRSFAGYLRGRLYEADGDSERAEARYQAEGFLLDWQIVGAFDNSSRAGHGKPYGPETEGYDPSQVFVGKLPGELLEWRRLSHDQIMSGATISFDELLDPNTQAVGYATTWVKVDKPGPAAIHLGAGGAYKVWVNGALVGDGDTYRIPHPLQEAHPVVLSAGWNRILIKLSVDDGLWAFHARLATPSGAPLTGLEVSAESKNKEQYVAPAAASVAAPAAHTIRSVRGVFEDRAMANRARAADKLALVELEYWLHPYEAGDRTRVARAREADEAVKSSRSAFFLSLADPDPNSSRAALDEAIVRARAEGSKSAPLLARLLVELAFRYESLGLYRRARALLDEAYQIAPDDVQIELFVANRLGDDGFPLLALEWVEDMLRRYPSSGLLLRERATRLVALGRTEEALTVLVQLQRGRAGDGDIIDGMIEGLLALGKADAAAEVARLRAAQNPGLPDAHRGLARLEEARGDLDAARAALKRATEIAPQDDALHAELGRLHARAGDNQAAIHALRRSLELKPQQPDVRDLLATLDVNAQSDLFSRYAVKLEDIAKKPTPKSWKGKDAGMLHSRVVVRVLANGLTERLEHRIIRILDERGARTQMAQGIAFDPDESYVDVRRARVRRADGTIEDLGSPSVYSLTEAGYRMYYDRRVQRVDFAGLRPGDTVEVAFVRRDIAARNKFDDYFGELVGMDAVEPVLRSEYILEAPKDRKLFFNHEVKRTVAKGGDAAIYRYVVTDRDGVRTEVNMPGWTEVSDYLHVSTFSDWDAVGRWYWDLVKDQLAVDARIQAGVREALKGVPEGADVRTKVHRIYSHVIQSTRYVGLEFGIHGYKPYRTTDIYDRKFGDCKDKASLLKVMLAEVGIESYLTLVRTRDQGAIGKAPASLAAFNHAIVYVPSLDLYLDGTAEFAGPDELPPGDQGAVVLVVKDGAGAELRTIPVNPSTANTQKTVQSVQIDADGDARVRHELILQGATAGRWRANLQSAESRVEKLTNAWGSYFAGLSIKEVATPGIDDVLKPVTIQATLEVPAWAQQASGGLRFPVFGYRTNLVRAMAAQARREHDLILTIPSVETHRVEYTLPRGYTFSQVPDGASVSTPMGSFTLKIEAHGNKATVDSRLEYTDIRIEPGDYRAFREFLRKVDASLEQTFEVRPAR
ncbi:MAG: DUF3857 domain-containing protein [Nannocystaceae bacterium]